MTEPDPSPEEQKNVVRHALLAGTARGLGLLQRVPELCRARGWALEPHIVAVLQGAVALKKIGAGRTSFRRPASAEGLGGKWPADIPRLTASQIVALLELEELLDAR